jgi:pachytene checkpoint protein 2
LTETFPAIGKLIRFPQFEQCAAECVGLDGRSIRKMVANALASSPQTAMNPERVTIDDLLAAAKAARANRRRGGRN